MAEMIIDYELGNKRELLITSYTGDFYKAVDMVLKTIKNVVECVDTETGETRKGPKYDTTTLIQSDDIGKKLKPGVVQKTPIEGYRYEPRDRGMFQEKTNMNELKKFRNLVKECVTEIKKESDPKFRLKESLRGVVKDVLREIIVSNNTEQDKDETEKIRKGYDPKRAGLYHKNDDPKRSDKVNNKLLKELESIINDINSDWEVYWDDYRQLVVRAHNMLYVRIIPKFEDNFDVVAMVKLVDRVKAVSLTWDQVKDFVKVNFKELGKGPEGNKTKADKAWEKSMANKVDQDKNKKNAGPDKATVKPRYIDPSDTHIKDAKKDDKNYNDPQVKKDEDMPDKPMKDVGEPESKNKNIKKTEKVKPPKHKLDKKLRVSDKKTPKFSLKQVKP